MSKPSLLMRMCSSTSGSYCAHAVLTCARPRPERRVEYSWRCARRDGELHARTGFGWRKERAGSTVNAPPNALRPTSNGNSIPPRSARLISTGPRLPGQPRRGAQGTGAGHGARRNRPPRVRRPAAPPPRPCAPVSGPQRTRNPDPRAAFGEAPMRRRCSARTARAGIDRPASAASRVRQHRLAPASSIMRRLVAETKRQPRIHGIRRLRR